MDPLYRDPDILQAPSAHRHRDSSPGYLCCMATLGNRVRALRKSLGYTQPKLAALAGVGQSTISELENGIIPTPGAEIVTALCSALKTNVEWLLHGRGQSGPTENAIGFDEVEALALMRKLDDSHRQAWLSSGRALLMHQTGKASEHDPFAAAPPPPAPTKKRRDGTNH